MRTRVVGLSLAHWATTLLVAQYRRARHVLLVLHAPIPRWHLWHAHLAHFPWEPPPRASHAPQGFPVWCLAVRHKCVLRDTWPWPAAACVNLVKRGFSAHPLQQLRVTLVRAAWFMRWQYKNINNNNNARIDSVSGCQNTSFFSSHLSLSLSLSLSPSLSLSLSLSVVL